MNFESKCKFLNVILVFSFFWSCSDSTSPEDEIDYKNITDISYSKHVQPILNEYREILSTANNYPPGLQMDSWENLIKGWERGEVIIPFDSENILLTNTLNANIQKIRSPIIYFVDRCISLKNNFSGMQ